MADNESEQKPQQETLIDDEFSLQSQQAAPGAAMTKKEPAAKQPSGQRKDQNQVAEVLSYRHDVNRHVKLTRILDKSALKSFHPELLNYRHFAGELWSDRDGYNCRNQKATFCQ